MNKQEPQQLAIVGASGHGKVVADLAETLGYKVTFYDDAYPSISNIEHWLVNGTLNDLLLSGKNSTFVFVAIGNNAIRESKLQLLCKHGFSVVSLIHPFSVISNYATIKLGCVVLSNAVINAFAQIGVGCIINSGAIIEHDCHISNYVHVSPNAALAGGVTIGNRSWIGIGANIKQLVVIGSDSIIGSGSSVIKNVPSNVIAFGSPAIVIKSNT